MIDETVSPSAADGIEGARLLHADGLIEVGLAQTAVQRDALFGARATGPERVNGLRSCTVVWIVADRRGDESASRRTEGWTRLGLRPVRSWQFNQSEVFKAIRVQTVP